LISVRAARARTQDGIERGQFVALMHHVLKGDIDDVGQIVTGAGRLPASIAHYFLRHHALTPT
jgi:hypothetical protein